MPGTDPVGRVPRSRLADERRRPTRGSRSPPTPGLATGPTWPRIPVRSSTSTGGPWPCAEPSPRWSSENFELLGSPEGTLAYRRRLAGDACTVVVNFTDREVDVTALGAIGAEVLLASDDPTPTAGWSGSLGPDRAVVVRG